MSGVSYFTNIQTNTHTDKSTCIITLHLQKQHQVFDILRRGEPGDWGGGGSYTGDFERWLKQGSLLGNSKIC